MSPETQFYLTLLIVYAAVAAIACWGLDLQFGDTGILNFSFVVSQAVGAYTYGLFTLGARDNEGVTLAIEYFWGTAIPFPLPFVAAVVIGWLVSIPIGWVGVRKLRSDYQAVAMIAVAIIANAMVLAQPGFLGGSLGLYLIPAPLQDVLDLTTVGYGWVFAGFCVVAALLALWVTIRVSRSPTGRVLRAIRENPDAAEALGKDITTHRLQAFGLGSALAALSGALLAAYLGAWTPVDWTYGMSLIFLGAVIIGGAGNRFGVLLGALLLPVALNEGVRFLPEMGSPGTNEALRFVLIGAVIIAFMWFRPRGIVPERRRTFDADGDPVPFYRQRRFRPSPPPSVTSPHPETERVLT